MAPTSANSSKSSDTGKQQQQPRRLRCSLLYPLPFQLLTLARTMLNRSVHLSPQLDPTTPPQPAIPPSPHTPGISRAPPTSSGGQTRPMRARGCLFTRGSREVHRSSNASHRLRDQAARRPLLRQPRRRRRAAGATRGRRKNGRNARVLPVLQEASVTAASLVAPFIQGSDVTRFCALPLTMTYK